MNDVLNKQDKPEFLSFRCPSCAQEIEAQTDMAATEAECPACGNPIVVPDTSEPGTIWGPPLTQEEKIAELKSNALKSRTLRIELLDDF